MDKKDIQQDLEELRDYITEILKKGGEFTFDNVMAIQDISHGLENLYSHHAVSYLTK